jgi:hypothetical protein
MDRDDHYFRLGLFALLAVLGMVVMLCTGEGLAYTIALGVFLTGQAGWRSIRRREEKANRPGSSEPN